MDKLLLEMCLQDFKPFDRDKVDNPYRKTSIERENQLLSTLDENSKSLFDAYKQADRDVYEYENVEEMNYYFSYGIKVGIEIQKFVDSNLTY